MTLGRLLTLCILSWPGVQPNIQHKREQPEVWVKFVPKMARDRLQDSNRTQTRLTPSARFEATECHNAFFPILTGKHTQPSWVRIIVTSGNSGVKVQDAEVVLEMLLHVSVFNGV